MSSSNGQKPPSKEAKEPSFKAFIAKLRKRRIIETLAAFVAGGWLLLEFVHWLLVDHYHFPETTIDITFVTILGVLICTLIWRWFSGREQARKFNLELVLIPLVLLITVLLDINLLLHLKEPELETVPALKWKNSIAVLPFVDLSPQKDQDWFCDGMTDEIISRLSKVSELKVPARTSVFFFKGKEQDIREIGTKLGVATVLEGSIQKVESKLRARVQLINIADGFHLWSEEYDRELKDVFAIQDEIALAVVDKLKLKLLGEEKARLGKRPTENLEAYRLYLLGRSYWNKRGKADLIKSIEYFVKAIEIDPNYALGYAGLGDAYYVLGENGFWPFEETYPKARTAALKALEIDDKLAEAHTTLASIMLDSDWDFFGAEKEFKLAIKLSPGYATARQWYAFYLSILGRHDEAIREAKIARNLDPLSPRISGNVGQILWFARRYGEALEELNKALEVDPNHGVTYEYLGWTYEAMGKYEEALKSYLRYIELSGGSKDLSNNIADCYALMGKREEARKILNNMIIEYSKGNYYSSTAIAGVFITLGEKDQAFAWLDKACQDRDPYLLGYPSNSHRYDPLRSDPRFTDLLRRIGLEK